MIEPFNSSSIFCLVGGSRTRRQPKPAHLQEYLLPEIVAARQDFGLDVVFMQDNAPFHKKNLIKENDTTTMDWPPQSPDLNPIKRAIINKRRQKKYGFPATKVDLI